MIHQSIINTLIIFGVYGATREGMIGHFIKKYLDRHLTKYGTYPLYECPKCMASVWSVLTAFYFGLDCIFDIIPIIIATSGAAYILLRLFPYND